MAAHQLMSRSIRAGVVCALVALATGMGASAQSAKYRSGQVAALGGTWLELDLDGSRRHVDIAIDLFSPVTLGFDAPAGTITATGELGQPDRFRTETLTFEARVGGRVWTFRGRRMGDVIDGSLSLPDEREATHRLRLIADDGRSRVDDLLGQYEDAEGHRFLLTYREFGQYRWIDVPTSRSTTLFSAGEDALMSATSVSDEDDDETRYRFLRRDGTVVAAVIDREAGRRTTLQRIDGLREELLTMEAPAGPMRASLLLPPGEGPHPAVIFVAGSGPIYRTALAARAALFQQAGLAVLLYDKRGTGTFGTGWEDPSIEALARDLQAVHETLRGHPAVDPTRIGFAGHSEAAYVIPEAIANGADPRFVILVSSSGNRPAEQTRFDKANDMLEQGYTPAQRDAALELLGRVQRYVISRGREEDWEELSADFVRSQREPWFDVLDLPPLDPLPSWDSHPDLLEAFRNELVFDPLENAAALTMPVMFLNGSGDTTSDAVASQRAWSAALDGINAEVHMVMVEGAEHGLRDESGVYVPEYMSSQLEWLRRIGILRR